MWGSNSMVHLLHSTQRALRKKRDENRQSGYERKRDLLYKRHGGEKALFVVMVILFILFAATFIFPFIWLFFNSLKKPLEYAQNTMSLPKTWRWSNFSKALTYSSTDTNGYNLLQMLGTSVLVAGGGTLATVITSSCAAWVVAKYKFPGRSLIFSVVIFSLIVPIVGSLPSQMQLMKGMGLMDSVIGVIFLYSGGFGTNFLLLYSFFKNLSWTYVEAAKIDGASDFRIFVQIVLPMAKGPMIAVGVLSLIGLWNDYLTPSIYLSKQPTISYGIYIMQTAINNGGSSDYPLFFAMILLTIIPILLIFILFNKTIMENTTVGGLKG